MATVIDSLVVLLGLDASNYKKGRETAEKETAETARKAQASADAITKSLTEVGRTVASLFLGFESASGLTKWLGGLNAGEAQLGRTAANIGMSAHELNKWGSAVTLAGGSAADAQGAFSQLTKDFQTMSTGAGPPSALLELLRNRGVNIRDQNGALRNQGQIFEELADKTAQYGRAYQITMFTAAGLSQGEAEYLAQSKELRADQLRLAEQNNNVDEDSVRKAQELQEYWRNIQLQIEGAGQKVLLTLTPYIKDAFLTVQNLMAAFKDNGGLTAVGSAVTVIGNTVRSIFNGWKAILDLLNSSSVFKAWDKYVGYFTGLVARGLAFGAGATDTSGATPTAATPAVRPDLGIAYRNNNPGNLRPYKAGQPVDARGIRVFASAAEGKAALDADITAKLNRGLDTIAKIVNVYAPAGDHNDVPAYIAALSKDVGKGANDHLSAADHDAIVSGIIHHEGAQYGPTPGATSAAKNTAAPGGSSTTVSVGTIQVNAPNADPRAVAEQVPSALQRKFSVSQADTGQS